MAKVVGYWPIKTKKGDDAYLVAYTKPLRAGQMGFGLEAGTQFVTKDMFEGAFFGVSPDKVVGLECTFVYNQSGFLEGVSATSTK